MKRTKRVFPFLFLLGFFLLGNATSSWGTGEPLSAGALKSLVTGERQLLILEPVRKGKIKYNRYSAIIVRAPLNKVWNVVTDFAHYADFVPEMSDSKIIKKEGNTVVTECTVGFKFAGIGCTSIYQQKHVLKKPKISIYDTKTNKLSAYWQLISLGGAKTLLVYNDEGIDPREFCALARALLRVKPDLELSLHVCPPIQLLQAMKKRAEGR